MTVEQLGAISSNAANEVYSAFVGNLGSNAPAKYNIAELVPFLRKAKNTFSSLSRIEDYTPEQREAARKGAENLEKSINLLIEVINSGETVAAAKGKVGDAFYWARQGAKTVDNAHLYEDKYIDAIEIAIANVRVKETKTQPQPTRRKSETIFV